MCERESACGCVNGNRVEAHVEHPDQVVARHDVLQREREREEGRCKATCEKEFKLPWRKAGPLKSSRW